MKKLCQFFDKFNSKAVLEIKKRELISKIIKEEINQDIPIENIQFGLRTIKIKGNSNLKSLIFIKKTKILNEVNKVFSNFKIENII